MRIHGQYWSALSHHSHAEKDAFNKKAAEVRSSSHRAIQDEVGETETRLQIASMRETSASETACTSMVASGAKLPAKALASWSLVSKAKMFGKSVVRKLAEENILGVQPITPEREEELLDESQLPANLPQQRSALYNLVARKRDRFLNACFAVQSTSGLMWYRCVLAIAQPATLMFMKVEEVHVAEVAFDINSSISTWPQLTRACFSFQWSFESVQFTSHDIFRSVDPDFAGVVTPTTFKSAGTLVAWSDMFALSSLLAEDGVLEEELAPKPKKQRMTQAETESELLEEHPWLQALLSKTDPVETHGLPSGSAGSAPVEETAAELDLVRREHVHRSNFGREVEHRTYRAQALRLTLSASFDYHAHGEETSKALAKLYMSKVMHVTRHWLTAGTESKLLTCPAFVVPESISPPAPDQKMSVRRWQEYLAMGPDVA
eukprot:886027-Amphidinium_carterae.2